MNTGPNRIDRQLLPSQTMTSKTLYRLGVHPQRRPSPQPLLRVLTRTVVLAVVAMVGLVEFSGAATAAGCTAGTTSDFDGDGTQDLVIGDPNATVAGKTQAGQVHIAYGDSHTQTIDADDVPSNENGAGERFGFAMDTVDWNGDGCSDLFIGAPYETWASGTVETGIVVFIPGSPTGLDTTLAVNWSQASVNGFNVDANETGDRFGWDLAAGVDTAGVPFVVIGVPGQSGTTAKHGGNVVYVRPGAAMDFNQDSTGVADGFEADDMFGYSVAASPSGFAVGIPGESVGTLAHAGTVNLFKHGTATAVPTSIAAWGQNSTGFSGSAEAGDLYGFSLDMVDYKDTASSTTPVMMLGVGSAGESAGSRGGVGFSVAVYSAGTGVYEHRSISQDLDGQPDPGGTGDVFGAAVAMVNRAPASVPTASTLLMAIGVPGEDTDAAVRNVGETQLFAMTEATEAGGDMVTTALAAAGHTIGAGSTLGATVHATTSRLWVTSTDPDDPAVYGIPWDNIIAGANGGVVKYTPAMFGSPVGTVSFGASLA